MAADASVNLAKTAASFFGKVLIFAYLILFFPMLILDFFRNSIRSVKPCFLAPSTPNFSAMCIHMAKKLGGESAQKSLVSPTKANFERSLLKMTMTVGILLTSFGQL